jgi:hypothetical protein
MGTSHPFSSTNLTATDSPVCKVPPWTVEKPPLELRMQSRTTRGMPRLAPACSGLEQAEQVASLLRSGAS